MLDKIRLLLALPAIVALLTVLGFMVYNAFACQWGALVGWWLIGFVVAMPVNALYGKKK